MRRDDEKKGEKKKKKEKKNRVYSRVLGKTKIALVMVCICILVTSIYGSALFNFFFCAESII